jgi:quercetin dioxygenase-like cupin family protein
MSLSALAALFTVSQALTLSQSGRPTTATDVTHAQLVEILKQAPRDGVLDQQIRVIDMGNYNLAIGALHRSAKAKQTAYAHSQVAEVYYVLAGAGTFVTGGSIEGRVAAPANGDTVKILVGPSENGTSITNGQSRHVGPGDVIVIPANVAHWFSAVEADMDYLVVRVDPDHVLPSGYTHALLRK